MNATVHDTNSTGMKFDLWTTLFTLVTAGAASYSTWKASTIVVNRRLSKVESQMQACLMLTLKMALAMGLDAEVLSMAEKALGPDGAA